MSELELRGVRKRLGDHVAVDGVSFRVDAGEMFVLLGSSGSGKTTLLRLVCGLETPDTGEIILDGRDISRLPSRERNLGMVFQEYGLYPAMDVRGNIAYGLEARGKHSKDEITHRVEEAAGKLGLSEMLSRSTQEMSGGEQQRVALARAMVKDASAYLFDEPLSNLDPKLRNRARRDIMAVHRAKNQPSVYVTHDQSEAFAMADRVGIMSAGKIQQVGTPDELLLAPANVFVARFVGSPPMNLLPGTVRRDGGGYLASADGLSVELPDRSARTAGAYEDSPVLVGFRPEALRPTDSRTSFVEGTVVSSEAGLTEMIVRFTIGDGTQVTAVFDDDVDLNTGDKVRFGIDPAGVHLFDTESERALDYDHPVDAR